MYLSQVRFPHALWPVIVEKEPMQIMDKKISCIIGLKKLLLFMSEWRKLDAAAAAAGQPPKKI